MSYEVVLFDADGTLFDFSRAEVHALTEAFREFDIELKPEHLERYEVVNRQVWRLFELGEITSRELRVLRFERFCEGIDLGVEPAHLSARYLWWLSRADFLLDGAREVVEALSGECRLGIVTNGLEDVQRGRFGRSTIRDHFETIVISEEIGVQKPDPAIFHHALEGLGHREKRSVLMVGDSLTSDIQGGINFGIDTCWFNPAGLAAPSEPAPRYVIRELAQLLPLCLSTGAHGEVGP